MSIESPGSPAEPTPPIQTKSVIIQETERFVRDVDALRISLPLSMTVMSHVLESQSEEFNTLLDQHGTLVSKEGDHSRYRLPPEHQRTVDRYRRTIERLEIGCTIIPRNHLIALVSQYDFFLARIIRGLYVARPELLNASERQITFAQLVELGSIDDARELLLEKDVESLLRKSHVEQFTWLETKFDVTLRKGLLSWPVFVELTERRNLFVHTDGMVSTQYLTVCRQQVVAFEREPLVGEQIEVTAEYFILAYECILEIGIKLSQVLWRKVRPDQLAEADRALVDTSFEMLISERFELAKTLLEFATKTMKKHGNEEFRRILIINLALAHKWAGNGEAANQTIDSEDWSASADKFQLAVAIIHDKFAEAAEVMKRIGVSGEFDERTYEEWPLFREFKKSPEFGQTFQAVFGKPFAPTISTPERSPEQESATNDPSTDDQAATQAKPE